MFLQLLLTCIIFTVDVRAQNCHQDWLYHAGSCYGFGETGLSWAEAQAMCRSFDAKLAEIETSSENDFIKGMATTKHEFLTSTSKQCLEIYLSDPTSRWCGKAVVRYPHSAYGVEPNGIYPGAYYWIGATDAFHEGVFEWASTRQNVVSFTDWILGDPNDIKGDEDCLVMVASNGYQWADAPCINPGILYLRGQPK